MTTTSAKIIYKRHGRGPRSDSGTGIGVAARYGSKLREMGNRDRRNSRRGSRPANAVQARNRRGERRARDFKGKGTHEKGWSWAMADVLGTYLVLRERKSDY